MLRLRLARADELMVGDLIVVDGPNRIGPVVARDVIEVEKRTHNDEPSVYVRWKGDDLSYCETRPEALFLVAPEAGLTR